MKTRSALLLGCGVLLVGIIVLGLAGIGFFYYTAQDPVDVLAYVEVPDKVDQDEVFELKVVVVNQRKSSGLKVSTIDLGESYLSGFTVRGIEPPSKSSTQIPFDESQSFKFSQTVPPGVTNIFTFRLRAAKPGIYRGDVDVCEGVRFLTVMAQTEVK